MNSLSLTLKLVAPIFVVVGLIHLVLGVGADVMLGAALSEQTLRDPVLDSQNRFYGIAFTIYGVLFFLGATDLERYQTVLKCLFAVFFLAGVARIVSIATHGLPSAIVLVLLGLELLLPAALWFWLSKTLARSL